MARLHPRCSIVIPVYNWASLTRQVLNCLLRDPPVASNEIIVVDDGSRDLTARVLAGYSGQIRVVTHSANQGYASACNDGAAIALGEYLVFLNNDTLPRSGWLDALVRYADCHPKAAVVGSKMVRPDGTAECTGVVMGRLLDGHENVPLPLYYGLPADHPAVNKSRPFQMVTGACMMIRRSAFEAAGGLDRAYVNGREDVDLCLRLGEMGHQMHYCHESEVTHLGSMTRWSKEAMDDPFGDIRSGVALFQQRWGTRTERDDVRYFLEDGLLSVGYVAPYRLRVDVAPVLGTLGSGEYDRESDRLLSRYAWRTFELMREKHRLQVRLEEDDLQELAVVHDESGAITPSWREWFVAASPARRCRLVADLYLDGAGVEIQGPHAPLDVPGWVKVRSLDGGDELERLGDSGQDFVIANGFIERCKDPPGALAAVHRVLKPGGIAYLVNSDMRSTLEMPEVLARTRHEQGRGFDLELAMKNEDETIVILRKAK